MKHFRLQILLRVLGLAATMAVAGYLFFETTSYVAAAIVTVGLGFQVYGLIVYTERLSRDLGRFLRSVRYSDFSQRFSGQGRGRTFDQVGLAFSAVMEDFRKTRAEKEENHRYLQTVVQHVGIGLLSFRDDGTVELINNAAKRLLRVGHLKNIGALAGFSPALVQTLPGLHAGQKALVKVVDGDELLELMIYAAEFKMRGERFTLVSLQDIQTELEEKEIEAWQKLTRVLTHEIMNSITPIASLAATVNDLLADPADPLANPDETLDDVRGAIETIERRSQSLLHFVDAYRSLTRIPRPRLEIFPVRRLFDDVARLLGPQMDARGVRLTVTLDPEELDLTADPELIGQVLINLLKNAMEAVGGRAGAAVRLTAALDGRGHAVLQVSDNGPGIIDEAIGQIFIPFFTTKKEGSGIGLSLSRQIMRQHGGTLSVVSQPDVRTVFTMRF